jgi:hypothetical protein
MYRAIFKIGSQRSRSGCVIESIPEAIEGGL